MQEQFLELDYQPMKACPVCGRTFDSSATVCEADGYELVQGEEDPLIGTWLLDRYVILSVLGSGGWGRVYKARHLTLGTVVAIKTLYSHLASNREKVTRFEQEARAACALRHENIAAVYDFGTMPNGQPFIVMDFLAGRSLHNLLQSEKVLEPMRAINICKQICAGLAAAHDRGIVHRDIKPGNIVLMPDPDRGELVKLFDFGLAKMHLEDGTSLNQLTQTGETVGTPAYMSPEQCQGLRLDQRTDLYSLGCVMYECLTGTQAFNGPTTYECMSKHVNEGAPPFSEVVQGKKIPGALEDIVFKALEKDPRKRYQSAREMLADLARLEGAPTPGGTLRNIASNKAAIKRPVRWLQRLMQRNKRATGLGGVTLILFAAITLLAYQTWRGFDPAQMSPNDRWTHFCRAGVNELVAGQYRDAENQFNQALTVAETFTTDDKRKVVLANQALLFHLMQQSDKERVVETQLAKLLAHEPGTGKEGPTVDAGEIQLLNSMMDRLTESKPVDKQQLGLLGDRINRICAGDAVLQQPLLTLERKNCDALKQYVGEDNTSYGAALQRLAYAAERNGQHAKSLELLLQCLPIMQKSLSKTDPEYFRLVTAVGTECRQNGKLEDAEKYLEEAAELKDSEPNPEKQLKALTELALVYQQLGNSKRESETWKATCDVCDRAGEYDEADWPIQALVFAGHRLGNDAETEKFLQARKTGIVSHYGQVSAGAAAYTLGLAELYLVQKKLPAAETASKEALETRQLIALPGQLSVGRAMDTVGRVYMAQGQWKLANALNAVYLACTERDVSAESDKGLLLFALTRAALSAHKVGDEKVAKEAMVRFHAAVSTLKPAASGYDCAMAIDPVFSELNGLGLTSQDYVQLEQLVSAQSKCSAPNGAVFAAPNPKLDDAMSRVYALSGRWKDAQFAEEKAIKLIDEHVPCYGWVPGQAYTHYAHVLTELGKSDEAKAASTNAAKYPLLAL